MEKTGFFNIRRSKFKTIEGQSIEGEGNIDLNKSDVGLTNVDNTSDAAKPVSNAQQTALDLKIDTADIIDNLTSTDIDKPLSANQGKILQDTKANKIIGGTDGNIITRDANGDGQDSGNSIANVKARSNHTGEQSISTITGLQVVLDSKIPIEDIVDNLTSTDIDKPLSANQGKELEDNKVDTSDIKNNLTSTDIDKPLSANQGKILQDTKATKITGGTDGNLIKQDSNGDIVDTGVSGTNFNGDNQLVKTNNQGKINPEKGIVILTGAGTPEGSLIGYTGQFYRDTSSEELFQKATGENTNTGWKQLTGTGGSINFGTTSGTATEGNDNRLLAKRLSVLVGSSASSNKKGVSFSYGTTIANPFFSLAMTSANNNDAFCVKVINVSTTSAYLEVYRADGNSWADSSVSCFISIWDGTY